MSDEDTKSWIYAGGLPYELTEGDIVCVFSQYGEILEISLSRDRDTGKSRGFCFIKYEDHRSCELAVDNLHGSTVVNRKIKVSHANNANALKSRRPAVVAPHEDSTLPIVEDNKARRLKRRHEDSVSPANRGGDSRPRYRESDEPLRRDTDRSHRESLGHRRHGSRDVDRDRYRDRDRHSSHRDSSGQRNRHSDDRRRDDSQSPPPRRELKESKHRHGSEERNRNSSSPHQKSKHSRSKDKHKDRSSPSRKSSSHKHRHRDSDDRHRDSKHRHRHSSGADKRRDDSGDDSSPRRRSKHRHRHSDDRRHDSRDRG